MNLLILTAALLQDKPGFTLIEKGANGPRETGGKAVTEAAAWAELWKAIKGGKAAAPAVDFAKEDVILVAWGQAPSGGCTVDVVRIERDRDETRIIVRHRKAEGPAIAVITYPFCIVRTPKITGTLKFVEAKD